MLEKERMYKMDHRENLKLFKDIKSKEKFSGYAYELNRVFGDRSYDRFYKNLFMKKRIHLNDFKKMFEKPIKKGELKKIQEPFDIKEFNFCLKKMEIKNKMYEYKIKHPHNLKYSPYQKSKDLAEKKKNFSSKHFHLPDIPDIGRYNPNYQSINTHSFLPIISSLNYDDFKKYKKNVYAHNIINITNSTNNINDINNIKKQFKLKANNNNFRRNQSLKTQRFKTEFNYISRNSEFNDSQSNISQYLSTSSFGDEKNNHCLKFDSYSPRKPLINKMYTTELVFNDSNKDVTPRNIKGVIDFNRISNSNFGSYFDEISRNSNNPPLGMYQPKYDFIEKKTRDIFLDKKEPISPKLAKLKKILCGYDISSEYKLAPGLNSNYNTINYETNKAI